MLKSLTSFLFLLLPISIYAQNAAQIPNAPSPKHNEPVVTAVFGFTYLQTDLTNTNGGRNSYLMGWYGSPQVNMTKHIGLRADFANYYNWHAHAGENVHGFLGGPVYLLPTKWVSPFVFVEGGALRDSYQSQINWNPAAAGGIGFNYRLTRAVSFQLVPGEYMATKLPNGNWQSNFNAKAGFVLNMYGKR